MHFLCSDLDDSFSVKSMDDVCASTENNCLYSKYNYLLKLSYMNQVNVIYP